MANLIEKLNQYDKITTSVINSLFTALESLRVKHNNYLSTDYKGKAFTTTVAATPNTIYHTTEKNGTTVTHYGYPKEVKDDLTALETSKYIPASYASRITIPNVGTIIRATEYYNDYVDYINAINNICCNDNNRSNNSVNSVQSVESVQSSYQPHNHSNPSGYSNYGNTCPNNSVARDNSVRNNCGSFASRTNNSVQSVRSNQSAVNGGGGR